MPYTRYFITPGYYSDEVFTFWKASLVMSWCNDRTLTLRSLLCFPLCCVALFSESVV